MDGDPTIRLSPRSRPGPDSGGSGASRVVGIGQSIGNYKLEALVGTGGFGAVYRCTDARDGSTAAVKIVTMPGQSAAGEVTARFFRECRVLAALSHPNIIRVFDFAVEQNCLFYAMEMVSGETLAALIQSTGGLPKATILAIMRRVLEGLDYMHGEGVLHRDLKPSNILMRAPTDPVLIDFGLARLDAGSNLTMAGEVVGTPQYMPPEVALGKRADRRADLYQVGIIIYYNVTGGYPYSADDIYRMMANEVLPPPDVVALLGDKASPQLAEAIARSVAQDPEDRFPSAKEMFEALGECPEGQANRPSSPGEKRLEAASGVSNRTAAGTNDSSDKNPRPDAASTSTPSGPGRGSRSGRIKVGTPSIPPPPPQPTEADRTRFMVLASLLVVALALLGMHLANPTILENIFAFLWPRR